jgi:hypothetical protein
MEIVLTYFSKITLTLLISRMIMHLMILAVIWLAVLTSQYMREGLSQMIVSKKYPEIVATKAISVMLLMRLKTAKYRNTLIIKRDLQVNF